MNVILTIFLFLKTQTEDYDNKIKTLMLHCLNSRTIFAQVSMQSTTKAVFLCNELKFFLFSELKFDTYASPQTVVDDDMTA